MSYADVEGEIRARVEREVERRLPGAVIDKTRELVTFQEHVRGLWAQEFDRIATQRDHAIRQAQCWKQEARTQTATVEAIYQLVGSHAGTWNGPLPVARALAEAKVGAYRQALTLLTAIIDTAEDWSPGLVLEALQQMAFQLGVAACDALAEAEAYMKDREQRRIEPECVGPRGKLP